MMHNLSNVCLLIGYDIQEVGIILADVEDEESLNGMCSRANIILNCVGPVSRILLFFLKLLHAVYMTVHINEAKIINKDSPIATCRIIELAVTSMFHKFCF